jgi:hypothetical protein
VLAAPSVAIHITGFGKFAGVALNPTMLIAQKLQRELDDHPPDGGSPLLRSSKVLEVSAVAVLMELAEIFHAIATEVRSSLCFAAHFRLEQGYSTACSLWRRLLGKSISLGVHGVEWYDRHANEIDDEASAEAHFRVADERGWYYHHLLCCHLVLTLTLSFSGSLKGRR